jgi:hypothetical protein
MDSLLHERIAIDGPSEGLVPKPAYLHSWVSPLDSNTREALLLYLSLYTLHFASPLLKKLTLWCRQAGTDPASVRQVVGIRDGIVRLLEYRCRHNMSLKAFFAAK